MFLIGFTFIRQLRQQSITPDALHFYTITVNNQEYSATSYTIDTVMKQVNFETTFGNKVTAPLERTVISQIY